MVREKGEGQNSDNKTTSACAGSGNTPATVKGLSRRTFIKGAAVGSIAAASVAGIAKLAVSLASSDAENKAYLEDIRQERLLAQMNYVLMSKGEKEEMVRMFIKSHKEQA